MSIIVNAVTIKNIIRGAAGCIEMVIMNINPAINAYFKIPSLIDL